ncbi:hypothetical protein BDY17DRAFT_37739 [Neohortaea acidophila]|uniref:Uncharacterized protein n=1 Tax=Neohortaea acidophila TaxID=245834 RepID=A0A6A6PHY8_9PEZI|nr:uncharacterized protein BDY17DRAFT_37739 [Neohortaea acidophila]KAF2479406.1 hypothetical protein BDY17DRAFT_37739 [Neohortaea acidophila]
MDRVAPVGNQTAPQSSQCYDVEALGHDTGPWRSIPPTRSTSNRSHMFGAAFCIASTLAAVLLDLVRCLRADGQTRKPVFAPSHFTWSSRHARHPSRLRCAHACISIDGRSDACPAGFGCVGTLTVVHRLGVVRERKGNRPPDTSCTDSRAGG